MPTNPLGKGTSNLTLNVDDELKAKVAAAAKAAGVSMGALTRAILAESFEAGEIVGVEVRQEIKVVRKKARKTGRKKA